MGLLDKTLMVAILLSFTHASYGQKQIPSKLQFDYELRLKVDFKQREAFLKKSGEEPAVYEKALSFISGSVHAADISDIVEIGADNYQINSIGTLTPMLNLALSNQKLHRQSYGDVSKDSLSTMSYIEKRGNTERLQAKLDSKAGKVLFIKDKTETGSAAITGNLLDLLNVMYTFVGRKPPPTTASYNITDSKSLKQYTLTKAELWDFPFNGIKVKAYRYFKAATKDDSSTLEIWLTEKDNIPLRMVVGLGERYGATIQADLKTIPAL
ncbi:Protein of unknown function [Polynucleobacter meluiroseus]|uniref:DUF3108 domain-containing protein n=1 Tax=Polynucleobacter meluiroseus TaxID=1938814 RepID=A0A240E0J2_9BURK|nr:DUF3108 domain-containing protein [Polynucleobacter meluiroseus]SNX28773.1 Protein of unknown function [Polynucleobacter meluiroseus]